MQLRYLVVTAILVLFSSIASRCDSLNEENEGEIYAFVIDKSVRPLPPPPPPQTDSSDSLSVKTLDSIDSMQLNIAVDEKYFNINGKIPRVLGFEGYEQLLSKLSKLENSKKTLGFDINSAKNYVSLINSEKTGKQEILASFDVLLFLSQIVYNKDKNKAAFVMGEYRGKLSGSETLFLLEKTKDGNWKIAFKKTISIS